MDRIRAGREPGRGLREHLGREARAARGRQPGGERGAGLVHQQHPRFADLQLACLAPGLAHLREQALQLLCHLFHALRAQDLERGLGVGQLDLDLAERGRRRAVEHRHRVAGRDQIVRELAADQSGPQQQHAALPFDALAKEGVIVKIVDGQDVGRAITAHRWDKGAGPNGQHQLAVGKVAGVGGDSMRCRVQRLHAHADPHVGAQLFCHLGCRLDR